MCPWHQQVTGPGPACTPGNWGGLNMENAGPALMPLWLWFLFLGIPVALETSDFSNSMLNWGNRSRSALTVTENRAGRDLRKWFRSPCSKAGWTHSQHFIFAILTIQRYQHDLSELSVGYLRLRLCNRDRKRWVGETQGSELSFSPYPPDNWYIADYLPLYLWCLLLCCFRQNKPNNK